jgi:hypothetical protein
MNKLTDVPKPLTLLDICQDKKRSFRRIDKEDANDHHIWKSNAKKASKTELTATKQELEADINDKASVSDLQAESQVLQGQINSKADATTTENAINNLGAEIELKANQSDLDSTNAVLADKATKTELNTAKQELQADIDSIEVSGVSESELNSAIQASYEKTRMRNENLVTNGFGELGDNTNFSDWTYDSTLVNGDDTSIGVFKTQGTQSNHIDEYIPIDPKTIYSLKFNHKNFSDGVRNCRLFGISYYTADKYPIASFRLPAPGLDNNELYQGCELAQVFNTATDMTIYLKPGHAQVFLDRYIKAKSHPTLASKCRSNLIRIDSMVSSAGRNYGYLLMNYYFGTWSEANVDVINDTITLDNLANSNGVVGNRIFPVGTKLDSTSYADSGSSWYYALDYGSNSDWNQVEFEFSDVAKKWAIRPGTSFVKLFWLCNWSGSGSTDAITAISGITLKPLYTSPKMVTEQISEERPEEEYKNSNLKAEEVPPIPIDKVTDLSNQLVSKATQADLDTTKVDVTNLGITVSNKANQSDLDSANANIALKASQLDLSLVTDRDFSLEANLVEHIAGSTITIPYAHAQELGLLFIMKVPSLLRSVKLYMKEADDVLVQIYNFDKETVIFEDMYNLTAGMNKLTIPTILSTGRYYITAIASNEHNIGYVESNEYNANHHFVAIIGGEINPTSFPDFTPGTTTFWGGFYELEFKLSTKSLYLGFQQAQLLNKDLVEGAFYQTNKNGFLMTYCFDGIQQITHA